MIKQLSMYDAVVPVPELWDCQETCRRFGECIDHPSWVDRDRCMLPGGNDLVNVVFDNRAFVYCKLYERRDDDA